MLAYNPAVTDNRDKYTIATAGAQQQMYNQLGSDIGGALTSIGNMYGKYKDKKDALAGMDKAIGVMSDIGAITSDFRDKYMAIDPQIRPFVFQAIASPMFQMHQKKEGYKAYADAMRGVYGSKASADSDIFEY